MKNQIYSNARCKAMESRLISKDKLIGLIDTYDANYALKVIKEYGIGKSDITNPLDFEVLLSEQTQKIYKLFGELSLADDIMQYIMLPKDFTNAEIIYKSRLTGDKSLLECITFDGMVKVDVIKESIKKHDDTALPKCLADTLTMLDSQKNLTGKQISTAFKRGFYEGVKIKDKDLINIHKTKIDLINTEMCFRARSEEDFFKQRISGGTLSDDVFSALLSKDEQNIQKICKNCYIYDEIKKILNTKSLFEIEKRIDDTPLNILNQYKYQTRDSVPSLRFIYMSLAEIINIRIVFVGIINKLKKESIKNRLRWQYEG